MEESDVDLRLLDYVSAYDSNLMCPICRCPFVDPVVIFDCDHHFCRQCLQQTQSWSQYSGNCPTCRRRGRLVGRGSASKLLANILDDLVVRCPEHQAGCNVEAKRGQIQDHVKIYCEYAWVQCPDESCGLKVRRRDAQACPHQPASCLSCREEMTVQDLDSHWANHCADHTVPCPSCASPILYRSQQTHLSSQCPETSALCPGHDFGCYFEAKRKDLAHHLATCTIAKLAPYILSRQQRDQRLEAEVRALKDELATFRSHFPGSLPRRSADQQSRTYFSPPPPSDSVLPFPTLPSDSSSRVNHPEDHPDSPPYTSPTQHLLSMHENVYQLHDPQEPQPYATPTQHLLSLHENLRDEVSRQATTIHEIDARLSTMLVTENMRLKDEIAYQGAQLSALMRQVGWLTSARLQGIQARDNVQEQDRGVGEGRVMRGPVRRTTDEGRTKL